MQCNRKTTGTVKAIGQDNHGPYIDVEFDGDTDRVYLRETLLKTAPDVGTVVDITYGRMIGLIAPQGAELLDRSRREAAGA
jgi:hypothetical protein